MRGLVPSPADVLRGTLPAAGVQRGARVRRSGGRDPERSALAARDLLPLPASAPILLLLRAHCTQRHRGSLLPARLVRLRLGGPFCAGPARLHQGTDTFGTCSTYSVICIVV